MPADLCFSADADGALTRLESDPSKRKLADQVNEALVMIEADPGDRRVRRRQYRAEIVGVAMWGVPARGDGEDWVILWSAHPEEPGSVVIHYIGLEI